MVNTITADDLMKRMNEGTVRVVNVLSGENYDQMHIRGSESIPLDELKDGRWEELDLEDDNVVYCANYSCSASEKAAEFLESKDVTVLEYEGGMQEWAEKGLPVAGELNRKEYLEEAK